MQTKTTLLIADDHAIVRDGLVALFQSQREFKVVAEAEDGRAAVRDVAEGKQLLRPNEPGGKPLLIAGDGTC